MRNVIITISSQDGEMIALIADLFFLTDQSAVCMYGLEHQCLLCISGVAE